MTGNVLQEYLVSLGFAVNQAQLRQFQNTLANVSRQVESHTAGLVRSYVGAAAAVSSAILGITGATVGLLDQTSRADLEYQKFALRMFMTTDAAKRMKIALDAMGESIEDIAWFPELRERYQEFMQEQKGLMPPGNFEDQMRRIRDIRNEFTRFTIIMNYGAQWVGSNLVKYLNVPIGEFQRWLIGVNDWLKENMPVWSDKIAYFFSEMIKLGKSAWSVMEDLAGAVGRLWDALSPKEHLLVAAGGLVWLFTVSPFARAVGMVLGLTAAIDDFYGYIDGKKSSQTLAPIWHNMLDLTKELKNIFKDLTAGVGDFFEALLPVKWSSIFDFLDDMTFKLAQAARIARIVITGLKAEPYRWDNSPEGQAKWNESQERLRVLNEQYDQADARHEREMKMSPEERMKRWQRQDVSAAGRASGTASEREQQAMAFLISHGVTPKKAAAVLGNIWSESSMIPDVVGDNGSSIGYFQHNKERRDALRKFAARKGTSETDPITQLEYAMTEPEWDEAMAAMNRESTMHGMARVFMEKFEKPAIMKLGSRGSFADQAYQNWQNAGAPGGPVGPQSFNTTVGSLNVYVANTNATPEEIAKAVKEELYAEQAWSNARMMREAAGVFG